jgi:hypothetical protein
MAFIVEKYVPLDPMNIGFLSFVAVMPRADRLADSIQQLRFRVRWHCLNTSFAL